MTSSLLRIRPLEPADVAAVVPLWQAGFLEMAPGLHARILRPAALAFFVALGVGLGARWRTLSSAGLLVAVATAGACAAAATTRFGGALARSLMWLGIQRQTRRDMTAGTISAVWQQPGESQFLVCHDSSSGALLGCVAVARRHTLEKESRRGAGVPAPAGDASLWRLTVAPAARRLGAGRALMAAAEGWARAHGCDRMSLICGNRESQQFYRRVGYASADEARARLVLFGPGGAPTHADVLGWLRLALLRTRVRRRGGTIMERALGEPAAPAAAE